MKIRSILLVSAVFFLFLCSSAFALPFSDKVDFNNTTVTVDEITKTVTKINDTGNYNAPGETGYNPAFTYLHEVAFAPEAASVDSATLSITHTGNRKSYIEAWFISDDSQVKIGDLGDSQDRCDYSWVTTIFDITSYLEGVSGSNWSISFNIDEHTNYVNEVIYVAKSVLSGEYTPVPEPATVILLGFGLAGFAGARRKKHKK